MVAIDQATAEHLKGVKPGINLPIIFQDKVIGVIGISGEPDAVHQYGELVKMTAELIIEQAALMSQVEWHKRHREELVMQLIQALQPMMGKFA
ncbi:sugar diacid utilization regulator SdaR [Vibrio ponticus]|nr:sugar diacid utilization regulator SdaR [Vibrio ponticus]